MISEVIQFQEKLNIAVAECHSLLFMTIAKELQTCACESLNALAKEAGSLKKTVVALGVDDAANAILAFEKIIEALLSELNMWIALKDDDACGAWERLIDAQIAAANAARAHAVAENMSHYAVRLEAIEARLFPPQVFTSPGMIIRRAQCSICGSEYGDCSDVKGRAYLGEMCGRIISDSEVTEVSFVDEPANKRCRMLSYTEDGVTCIDCLTLRPFKASEGTQAVEGQRHVS